MCRCMPQHGEITTLEDSSMKYQTEHPTRTVCLLLAAALWSASSLAQAATPAAPSTNATMPAEHSNMMGSADMKQSMKAGMNSMQSMQSTGDTDKDFATMMKMHHQQALDMAKMELEHGKSPELKKMASKIIAGQQKEIAQFDRWLAKQK